MSNLRLRFAPSPTGYLHVGGARTALFNWLLAKKENGTFILRIEDTDLERSTEESVDAILEGMKWLGLDWDEGPYFQSANFELYRKYVNQLLDEGKAYRCYCTTEELERKRALAMSEGRKPKYDGACRGLPPQGGDLPYVVRFRGEEEGATSFDDLIKGKITFPNEEMDDLIICRSDGTPTYNFCVAIDDAAMKITLVIRGDDHVNNTPRQIQIYKALGFPVPAFAHVPMILGSDKTRLSKRHGATSVMAYRDMGFLPEALANYLVRLGWSHGDDEIFSREEMIRKFDLKNVGRSPSVFSMEKLLWLNAHYIKTGDAERLASLLIPFLAERGISPDKDFSPPIPDIVRTLQERSRTLVEMADAAIFYFKAPEIYDEEALSKFEKKHLLNVYSELIGHLESDSLFTTVAVDLLLKEICSAKGWKMPQVGQPLRIALSGGAHAPAIADIITTLGIPESLRRIKLAKEKVSGL